MKVSEFKKIILVHSETEHRHATLKANRLALETLERIVGNKHIEDLSVMDGHKFVAGVIGNGNANSTANGYVRVIKACLQRAVDWELISDPHPFRKIKKLKEPKKLPPFIPIEKIPQFLLGVPDVRKRLTISAYLATGRRRVELLSLKWSDVNWETEDYHVTMFKTAEEKDFPISKWFKKILIDVQALTVKSGSDLIFPWWLHPDSVTHFVKEELIRGGFPDYHLHHLRHTFATHHMTAGGDIFYLQELLGHSDIKMTMRYAHKDKIRLREEANRVDLAV